MSKYHPQFVPIESGTVFGRYTVKEHWKHGIYFCECVCGKRLKISSWELTHGRRQGCNRCVGGLAKGEASFNELYGRYRRNAEKFKRDFTLTKEQAKILFLSNCHYCGDIPSLIVQKKRAWSPFIYNGVDRVDNAVGYVLSNCLPCCAICNHMKHILSYEDFLRHIKKIAEHRG